MTRKGHCQLENRESNLGVSHVFLSTTPPHGILAKQAQGGPGASPELQRQGRALSALGGLSTPRPLTAQALPLKARLSKRTWVCGTRCPGGNSERSGSLFSDGDEALTPHGQMLLEIPGPRQGSRCSPSPSALEGRGSVGFLIPSFPY